MLYYAVYFIMWLTSNMFSLYGPIYQYKLHSVHRTLFFAVTYNEDLHLFEIQLLILRALSERKGFNRIMRFLYNYNFQISWKVLMKLRSCLRR